MPIGDQARELKLVLWGIDRGMLSLHSQEHGHFRKAVEEDILFPDKLIHCSLFRAPPVSPVFFMASLLFEVRRSK